MPRSNELRGALPESDELAVTKLAPQDREEGQVVRQRLLSRLDDILQRRLTLVHAAAGYGKTSLLIQWLNALRKREIRAVWLTLEDEERDPAIFLAHITAALVQLGYFRTQIFAGLGQFDEKLPITSLSTAFINSLAKGKEPLVIFLDEYNRAQSEETDALIRLLIRRIPRHAHFVIASRWRPHLNVEDLRVRGDLIEISADELRFSEAEAIEFLAESGSQLSRQELHRLTDRTEGWPIALQMARLWLKGDKKKARLVSQFSGRTTELARYLAEQVLSELPPDQQDFLLQTAVLERVHGDLADAVTGKKSGWKMLEHFHERNLFLVPEDDDRRWFRYHALFLDFLRDRLYRENVYPVSVLHRQASIWLANNGMIKSAVYHAFRVPDDDLAACLLSEAGGWRLIMDGRLNLIRNSVAGLTDATIRRYPRVALAKALLLVKAGNIKGAQEYLASLGQGDNANSSEQDVLDFQILQHMFTDYGDEPVTATEIQRLQNLRERVSEDDHVAQAMLCDSLATRYLQFGFFKESLGACDEAITHYRIQRALYGEVFLRFTQAKAHLAQGRLDEAEAVLRDTETQLETAFGEPVELSALTAIYLSELLVERALLAKAAERLNKALPIAEQSDGWYELYAAAYTAAAAVAWDSDGLDGVRPVVQRAHDIATNRGLDRLSLLADCELVYYLCFAGRTEEASTYIEGFEQFLQDATTEPRNQLDKIVTARLSMTRIATGDYQGAEHLLNPCLEAAEVNGEIHQLIALRLVAAHGHAAGGRLVEAAQAVDLAVRDGVFTGLKRSYTDFARLLLPVFKFILSGKAELPPDRYRDGFLRSLSKEARRAEKRRPDDGLHLTTGELAVLRELDHGFSNKEIARHLGISPNTVKYRLKHLFAKLGVSARTEAVRLSRELDLISSEKL